MTKALDMAGNRTTDTVARLKASGHHPNVDRGRWYQVYDPTDLGFFIEQLPGVLRFYFWEAFEVREAPGPAGDGGK